MSFDRGGKGVANERKYPFIVEVPVAATGLNVALSGQIVTFHKSRQITPRFSRVIWRNEQRYFRWCFSDLQTARLFIEQFGGALYKTRASPAVPSPGSREDIGAAFVVRDKTGQGLAYVYYEEEPGRRSMAKMLTKDEARRIAANIAKLPRLLWKR